jgi:hypothetical protein
MVKPATTRTASNQTVIFIEAFGTQGICRAVQVDGKPPYWVKQLGGCSKTRRLNKI